MIVDARALPSGTVLEADLCVVGSGPAGITIARELNGLPIRVLLLEAGGLEFAAADQELYAGENVGLPYERLDRMRSRYLGGCSNCWGGFSRPMDAHDFEARDWVPNSGWPFGRDELLPWYRRAHRVLQLAEFDYDPASWEQRLNRPDAHCLQFDRERAVNVIAQLSPPTQFGIVYRDDLAGSANITACLNANVTEIEAPGNGSRVDGLVVQTREGGAFRVKAHRYVLATGGVESVRLLLSSNRHQRCGVGNFNDLVGRYFMDHPRFRAGVITFRDAGKFSRLYDMHVVFPGHMMAAGIRVGAYFSLAPEVQRAERVGNTRCYVVSRFVGDDPATYDALALLYLAVKQRNRLAGRYREVFGTLGRNLPKVAVLATGLKFMPKFLARGFTLETVVEPTPLPDSRVTLGDERDALGMRRVKLNWQIGELEKRTIRRTQEILGEEMQRIGAGAVTVEAPHEGREWGETPKWCWHHMGTTRMHEDPRRGVVDAQCKVHGMHNLYIAGSSVFPTCGSDMPTITVVALALRLAAHLANEFRAEAIVGEPAWRSRELAPAGPEG